MTLALRLALFYAWVEYRVHALGLIGHLWGRWSPYSRAVMSGPQWSMDSEFVAIEVGQRRDCQRCVESQYRGVWFDAPHPSPFEEEKPWP